MICSRGQATVGTLAQRRIHGMKLNQLICYVIGSLNAGAARIVIVKFPGGEFSIGLDSAFDFNHARGTEIGPSEFFFASPNDFDGAICGAREACSFKRCVARVLAAVS